MPSQPDARPCSESRVEMTEMVLPQDTNYHGTVFGGRVLQWIDIAGAISAQRHCRGKVVTASMDDMHFVVPIHLGDVVVLQASVNYTHRTSMEVGVRVEREERDSRNRIHAATAYLTFVAVDADGAPLPVPPVEPQTEVELRRNRDARIRRSFRLARRKAMMERL